MTAKTMCILHGCRNPTVYHAAFPIDSVMPVSGEYQNIGVGYIHSYNGNPYPVRTEFNFYITKKSIKKFK